MGKSTPEERARDAAGSDAPERNPASLRALREAVGVSQTDLAQIVGVQPRAVRRWESSGEGGRDAPDDVWEWLGAARARQMEVCSFAVRRVLSIEAEQGRKPDAVSMPYPTDSGAPVQGGTVGMVRANARLVAHELERRGFKVRFVPAE